MQLQGETSTTADCLAQGDLETAPIEDREKALLRLTAKITNQAARTTDADVRAVRDSGWSDEQIAEAVYVTAMFALFNRVADAFGLQDPGYASSPVRPAENEPE